MVVLPKGAALPKTLRDGTLLTKPISISEKLEEVIKSRSIEDYCDLQAALTAVSGMLTSDGITIVDSSGRVLAYNVFIALGSNRNARLVGGARKRTFEKLKEMVKKQEILAAFFQSQDGECECIGGKNGRK
jgi:hypothetical protein